MRNVATVGLALGIGWLATACKVDMNVGDWLTPDLELGGTDSGSGSGSGGSGSGDKGDPDPQTKPACIEEEQGDDTSCKDVATWKDYAWQACEAQGLELSSYSPREECGTDAFRYVDYSCCPQPTPPSSCTKEEQGDDTSCKDVATWKDYAWQACEAQGLELSSYSPREECGTDAFRYVDYSCCPPVTPPGSCTKEQQGSDTSCKDVATWKQYADQACASHGLLLSSYAPREECGKDAFRYVDYSCCPQVTPPSSCIKEEQGGDTSCKDVATWKQYASQACEGQGLQLSSYAPREECGKDAFRYVDYSCCPQVTPPSSCIKEEQGGATSCKDVATWKQYASQACEGQGLQLSSYAPREECGKDAFRYVDYSCCPTP